MKGEKDLLLAARQGDSKALSSLLSAHEKSVYRFGLRMCGSEDAAKEVLQETLLSAFRNVRDFRAEAKISTWLFQIARSFCLKHQRRRVDEPEALESLDAPEVLAVRSPGASPEEGAHARELGELLSAAIASLPIRYREALLLRDVEGLSAEEAAEVQGIDVANHKTRLHRARLALRTQLGAVLKEPEAADLCPELVRELGDMAERDEVEKATCARIEEHLARCERCASLCDRLKEVVSLCQRIPGDEVPSSIRAAVRQALRGAAGPAPRASGG